MHNECQKILTSNLQMRKSLLNVYLIDSSFNSTFENYFQNHQWPSIIQNTIMMSLVHKSQININELSSFVYQSYQNLNFINRLIQFSLQMAEQQLRTYYNYLYPFHTLVKWLTHRNTTPLAHRQLSFEYEGVGVERYVVFADADAMKSRMISAREKTPLKVDAGAIWDIVPEKESKGRTVQRELIFDFDMNDYDDVRTCCVGKTVCVLCWKLLVAAVEVIERALAQDFGFHQLMFVFSGGRGLHIWVCDKRAMELKDSVRKALVDYLQLVTGNEKATSLLAEKVINKVDDNSFWKGRSKELTTREEIKEYYLLNYVSLHVERSLAILRDRFIEIMTDQKAFESVKCIELMLKIIATRSEKLKERVNNRWLKHKDSSVKEKFDQMVEEIVRYENSETVENYNLGREPDTKVYRLTFIEEQIFLSFLYPRMDYNVSTMQNHLLKLPFSVHPSSRKISIPLFKRHLKGFNPKECVTIHDLLKDLDYKNISDCNQTNAMKSWLCEPIKALQEFTASLQ